MSPVYQRTGNRRNRIEIQAAKETRTSKGSVRRTWKTIKKKWAEIVPTAGREFHAGMILNAEITHIVNMPHMKELTNKHRILYKGRVFDIQDINNYDERNVKQSLTCIERVK